MKLPISLLVLAALSQALSEQPVTKRSEAKSSVAKTSPAKIPVAKSSPAKIPVAKSSPAKNPLAKSSVAKQKDDNQTSKRELYEGNFGERNKDLVVGLKYEVTGPPPKIVYAKDLQDMISEQSPTHQIFGERLPQIAKISDVLSGHGPSFEAAVAKHLYSPTSVYHARLSSPTSFEVPTPAASQSAYTNPKTYKLQADADNEQKLQEVPSKGVELPTPDIPLYTVNQPRLRFEAYPQPLDSGLSRQHENLSQEIFRPQQVPRKVMASLFPIYDQLRPFRYPGQIGQTQFFIVPARPDLGYGNQEGNNDKNYPRQENHEQLKAGQNNLPIDIPVPKQGYHAHPNGAISFASFSHNLPVNTHYETAPQPQSETFHQPQPTQLQSQLIPAQLPSRIQPEVMLQSQEQKLAPVKQQFQIPAMFHRLIQDLEKYQPVYQQQPQFIPFKQRIQNQPRMLNALQQHLLFQDPRQLSNPHVIQLQRLPAFKPLPNSLLSPESFLQQTSRSPVILERSPRPFSYEDQSTQKLENFDQPLEPASTQVTPLPPLKHNYSKFVKPLEPESFTTSVFLPTPLQPLPMSIPKQQPVFDQLVSSTTIQPNVKVQEDPKKKETQPQSQAIQPLKPEISHQSQPTVQSPSIQSTTYLPFVTHEPKSTQFQYSTPQPVYQSTIRPSPLRHDVVIQRQEIQELFFEPSPQPSSTPHYPNQLAQVVPQQEREVHHLRTQPHHQLFEQLQPLQFQREIQDMYSQQYRLEARQSKSPQKPDSFQQGGPQQYLIQQHSHPLQFHHSHPLQFHHSHPKQLSQQSELEQSQEQQQVYQAQQQQHESEKAQQQQQASEQAQQQQEGSEQAQQQQQGPEQQQYQELHLDSNNQIQISTLKPTQDTEKQTETVEIQQQSESQPQLQQQSNLQLTTGKPKEQPEDLSELTPNVEQPEDLSEPTPNVEQPYLGPLLTSSDLPQIYAHQQQFVAQPEYSPLLGVPSYSDVQYFGKFAETLFGNEHH